MLAVFLALHLKFHWPLHLDQVHVIVNLLFTTLEQETASLAIRLAILATLHHALFVKIQQTKK